MNNFWIRYCFMGCRKEISDRDRVWAVASPLPLFSFTGSKASFTGDISYYGKTGPQFYTQIKTVTQQWKDFPSSGASSSLFAYDAPSNSEDVHAFQSIDFTSNDVSLGLHLRDFSNGEGVPLPLHDDLPIHDGMSLPLVASKDFPSSDGQSLKQSRHLPNSERNFFHPTVGWLSLDSALLGRHFSAAV